jgi:hypothetical protein
MKTSKKVIAELPRKIPIIGISGKLGAGKDKTAEIICESFPGYQKRAFADNVRKVAHVLTGISVSVLETRQGKCIQLDWLEVGLTAGILMQRIGAGMREKVNPHVWIRSALRDVLENNDGGGNPQTPKLVVSDVRFKNEANAILELGGLLIRLEGDPAGIRRENLDMQPSKI